MQEYVIYSCTPMYRFISLRNAGDSASKLTPGFAQCLAHALVSRMICEGGVAIITNIDVDHSFVAGLKSRCSGLHNELNYQVC